MPKKAKSPKVSPEELLESLRQEEAERYATEQDRLRGKDALELKEYNQRRMLLLETMKFFRRLEKAAAEHGRQLSDRKEWTDFLSCRTPPNPASPPELRECLFRWTFQQDALEKSSVSWTLAADERSPLTQDPGRKRNTRKDLRQAFRNIGEIYLPPVRAALSVLESLQAEEPTEEIALVRDEIRKFISDSLDKMTVRIGSNIGRDMETLNPVMSDFQLEAPTVLAMYLWSFRPVPLAPDYNLLMKVIDMVPLALVLHRPPALELRDCLIRAMWLQFDHYSNMDPTRAVPPLEPAPDLIVAQETEWNERQDVRRARLAALRKLREDYESEQRRRQAEAEALESQKGGPGKATASPGPKKVKPAKQAPVPEPAPAVITDETEVDIDGEFERQQSDRFWDTLATVAPKSLPLRPGYINLREYAIVGGIYDLARFDRLPQPVELRSDFIYSTVPVGLKLTERGYRGHGSEELIKIELQLPAHCHWWEEPTVCCWERWEAGDQFAQLSPEVQQFHRTYDEIEARKATLLFAAPERRRPDGTTAGVPKNVQDFCLVDTPVELRLHFLIRDHLLPRVPEGYRFRAELRRLFAVLTERAESCRAREHERMSRNGMLQKYDQFLTGSLRDPPGARLSEMRLPIAADIDEEWDEPEHEKRGSVALQEMDEKLQQFPLAPLDGARYLHPPVPLCQPLIIGQLDGTPANADDLEQEMEALLQRLESRDAMLDNGSDERLCKLFSTFVSLLEYLREREKQNFPPLPAPSVEGQAEGPEQSTRAGKRTRRRQVEIRTTKKYPHGLNGRPRTLSGSSVTSLPVDERKKRKRRKSLDGAKSHRGRLASQEHQGARTEPISLEDTGEEGALSLIEHEPGRWSTKPIRSQSYDPDRRLLTFYTDRLGIYGLAARKYCNVPFLHWDIRRHGRMANLTAAVTVSTGALRVVFYVTGQGYRVALQEHGAPPPDVIPAVGTLSLEQLEQHLQRRNVHVFPQVDTCFYVAGLAAPKHRAMESHSLRCLGVFCLTHNFQSCLWNRYAGRRTSLVLGRQLIEGRHEPELGTIMITPLKSQHVEVEELCSDTLDEIRLAFHPRPADQSYNADCYGLLKDGLEEPSRKALARTPALLQWHVGQLLGKLRLLSHS
uniref:IC97/Casc1 N-terminal domain-containing protein n=1 Tax=Anopheles dirus TaxID=7168 RepID=A0A182NQQ0_9DIPT